MHRYEINPVVNMLLNGSKEVIHGHFNNSPVSVYRLNPRLVNGHGAYR